MFSLCKFLFIGLLLGLLPIGGNAMDMGDDDVVVRTEAEWRHLLTAEQYHVLREKGTERAFSGALYSLEDVGVYHCAGCGRELFSSEVKYRSGTGWPSFWEPIDSGAVDYRDDYGLFSKRTEVLCKRCGSHLGHVFPDGPPPTGQRFCINSVALDFRPN